MTIENLPIIFMCFVGIGMLIVLIGIVRLASHQGDGSAYTSLEDKADSGHLEDLFSFFLQEEEKKNQQFRNEIRDASRTSMNEPVERGKDEKVQAEKVKKDAYKKQVDKELFTEIIRRYNDGQDIETIAKDLKKGIGEVKLIISLYSIR